MHTTQSDKNHKINKPMTHIKNYSFQNICIFAKSNQCDKYHFNLYCYEQKKQFSQWFWQDSLAWHKPKTTPHL